VTFAFATSGPLMSALNLGQTTPLVLLALLLGERALARGREARAGAWLAAAAMIKVPLLAFLPYFAYRRRWRVVASGAALLAAAAAVSLAVYGAGPHAAYLDAAFARHLGAALTSHSCQSVAAVVARLSTTAPLWSWQPVALPAPARFVHATSVIAILAAAWWSLRGRTPESYAQTLVELALVLSASLLVAPIYWTHYGLWLVPAAVALAAPGDARVAPALVVALLLVNFPIPPRPIIERFDGDLWFRALISHQAAGTLLLFGVAAWRAVTWSGARRADARG
jgi:hypothetical protein